VASKQPRNPKFTSNLNDQVLSCESLVQCIAFAIQPKAAVNRDLQTQSIMSL